MDRKEEKACAGCGSGEVPSGSKDKKTYRDFLLTNFCKGCKFYSNWGIKK